MTQEFIELKTAMIPCAHEHVFTVLPQSVNTEILSEYYSMLPKDGIVDVNNSPYLAEKALEAMSLAKLYARVCGAFYLAAKSKLAKQESYVFFTAADKIKAKYNNPDSKITDSARNTYVDEDDSVLALKDICNAWQVLSKYFDDSVEEFRDRHRWYRNVFSKDLQSGDNLTGENKNGNF